MLKVNRTVQPAKHGGVIYHTGWSPSAVRACGSDGPSCHKLRALRYSALESDGEGPGYGPCSDAQLSTLSMHQVYSKSSLSSLEKPPPPVSTSSFRKKTWTPKQIISQVSQES